MSSLLPKEYTSRKYKSSTFPGEWIQVILHQTTLTSPFPSYAPAVPSEQKKAEQLGLWQGCGNCSSIYVTVRGQVSHRHHTCVVLPTHVFCVCINSNMIILNYCVFNTS